MEFPSGARQDSRYLLAKEAGMNGSIAIIGSSGRGNAAIDGGLICRAAEGRFGISVSSAIW